MGRLQEGTAHKAGDVRVRELEVQVDEGDIGVMEGTGGL